MARIVIDIPDELYEKLNKSTEDWACRYVEGWQKTLAQIIRSGTVLPKVHGNLVDADKVILGLVYGTHIDKAKCGEITKIFDNAVVIHADKGE